MNPNYKIQLSVNAPELVDVSEKYEIVYTLKNIGEGTFPGGEIGIVMMWSELGGNLENNHPLKIPELIPDAKKPYVFYQTDKLAGMTYLSLVRAVDNVSTGAPSHIPVYLPNGNAVPKSQVFHSIRVRSKEEILQEQLITALENSSKTQDRLAKAEVFLGAVAAIFTLIQIILAFTSNC